MKTETHNRIVVFSVVAVVVVVVGIVYFRAYPISGAVASGRYALTPAIDAGGFYVDGRTECEDGTAPTVGADGVGRCPYTYAQQMRARNRRSNGAYFEGIDDALETWMLLDLELKMKGECKTNGERANIVRQRHGMEAKR